jgi:hypothetical protein
VTWFCEGALIAVDFSDINKVIEILALLQPASDDVAIKIPRKEILAIFAEHGYYPDMNCDPDFDIYDDRSVAGYIIGQALSGIAKYGAIHQRFPCFIQLHKERCRSLMPYAPPSVPMRLQ